MKIRDSKLGSYLIFCGTMITFAAGGIILGQVFLGANTPENSATAPTVEAPVPDNSVTLKDGLSEEPILPARPAPDIGNFSQVRACLVSSKDRVPVTMYLADSPELRSKGLQGVTALPARTGMLFVYDELRSSETKFWMYNTPMNLDIAYLDVNGIIRTIQQMPSCSGEPESCSRYRAGVPFLAAAEFPQGFFQRHGITVGDRLSTDYFATCQVQPSQ